MKTKIDTLVILDITTKIEDKIGFEAHLHKEGFRAVEGENFVYTGISTTTIFSTKAYILEVFAEALALQNYNGEANLIFLLNEKPYPTYSYDKSKKEFEEIK